MNSKPVQNPGGLKHIVVFSLPMILSQACESLMVFTDRYLLSLHDPTAPSAAQVGGLTAFLLWIFGTGLLGYTSPLVAQFTGAGQADKARCLVPQVFLIAILLACPILLWGENFGAFYFHFLKIPAEEYPLALQYFSLLSKGCFFVFIKVGVAGYFSGIGQTRTVMSVNLLGLFVNIPLSYTFINGALGHAWSGVKGAALGTLIAEALMASVLTLLFVRNHAKGMRWRFHRELLGKLLFYGAPTGLEFLILSTAFSSFLTLFHSYGLATAQAITIVMSWGWLTVLPFFGLGIGISSLVGHALGEGNTQLAEKLTKSGIWLALVIVGIASIGFLFFTKLMIAVFSGSPGHSVNSLAITMLRTLPLYCLFDALSFVLAASLRAAGDTRFCLKVGFIAHWTCLVICYFGIFYGNFSALSIWGLFIFTLFGQAFANGYRYVQGSWKKLDLVSFPR